MVTSISDVFELAEAASLPLTSSIDAGQMTQAVEDGDRHITFKQARDNLEPKMKEMHRKM